MKDKLLAALKAKFQGVNASILDRIATQLAKTVNTEDQVQTAVDGVTKGFIDVIEAYGDSRATDAQKTAVQNYEAKYGLKDGAKIGSAEPAANGNDNRAEGKEAPAWAMALIDSNKQLTERLNKIETERTSASRKAELEGIIDRLPETLRKGYQRISVDTLSNEEFETLKGEVSSEVEAISKEQGAKGAVFGRPTSGGKIVSGNMGGNADEATDEEATAVVDKLNIF